MIRNLKVLGLALGVVFAFGAVIASGAMAQGMLTSTGPVTLTAEETSPEEPQKNQLSAFEGQTVRCPESTYTGHAVKTFEQTHNTETAKEPTHEFIEPPATTVTITPHYVNCKASGVFPATVDMNGCDYEFHIEGTSEHAEDTYKIKATVVCPTGKHITLTLFKTAADHTAGTEFCHITVTENAAGYNGLVVRDTTNGHLDITGTATGITVHRKLVTGHSSIFCGEKTDEAAALTQDITVKGHNEAGEPTSISLSDTP